MGIVFLNPPGLKLYLRLYYCSQTSKAAYYPPPIDFIMLSAHLRENNELFLLDAIKDHLNIKQCINKLKEINPEVIVFLSGIVSWREDRRFLYQLKK